MSFSCHWLLGLLEFHFLCYRNLLSNCPCLASTSLEIHSCPLIRGSREVNSPAFHLSLLYWWDSELFFLDHWGPFLHFVILSVIFLDYNLTPTRLQEPVFCLLSLTQSTSSLFTLQRSYPISLGTSAGLLSYLWDSEKGVPSGFVPGVFVTSHSALAKKKALNRTLPLCSASQTSGIIFS